MTWTGDGFTEVKDNAALEYAVTNVPYTGEYNLLVRYEPKVSLSRNAERFLSEILIL